MTMEEMRADLARREELLQAPPPNASVAERSRETDQWRVYKEVTAVIGTNAAPARFVTQASAGTGKSFLLETIFLWCVVHGHVPEACAPTGIAAARIHVPRTPVRAYTLHYLFGLRGEDGSSIDLSKLKDEGAKRLRRMTVLLQDEFSMADDEAWRKEREMLGPIAAMGDDESGDDPTDVGDPQPAPGVPDNAPNPRAAAENASHEAGHEVPAETVPAPPGRPRRQRPPRGDVIGKPHMLIFVDFKQLPPATGRPPFIAGDGNVVKLFLFFFLSPPAKPPRGASQRRGRCQAS